MKPSASIDPKQLGVIVEAFARSFFATPENADFVTRTRMTLEALPDDTVRELSEAVDVLAALTKERLKLV